MKKLALLLGVLGMLSCGAMAQEELPVVDAAAAVAQASDASLLAPWEIVAFLVAVIGVIGLGIWKSSDSKETAEEKEKNGAADYFLAGRGLSWWLVGFSLIAANISTEQFVGTSGLAANWVGLAIAGYEWLAAITLVVVAFTFLPMLLKRGVFTIPQFLEERYDGTARSVMAIANLLILVGVPTAAVILAGAKVVSGYFDISMTVSCIAIAGSATLYVFVGGLKACAWTDLIWGAALIFGGGVVAVFALELMGQTDPQILMQTASATSSATVDSIANATGLERFIELNSGEALTATNAVGGKLSMIRPADDPEIPWTALCLGLWIPNFFYWGLNQYIMQRTLASKSLAEGQKGVVFAAALKLLIPFVVIVPGIIAYNLFNGDMQQQADNKNVASLAAVEASGKTPLYNVSPDYFVADVVKGTEYLTKNAAAAGTPEQQAAMATALATVQAAASAGDADAMAVIIADNKLAVPASVTDVDKQKRIAVSYLVLDACSLNAEIIGAKAKDPAFATSAALNGHDYDSAFAMLLRKLLPGTGWAWFVLAALFGAVVSSLASMLNSASTLFTMDIYNKIRKEQSSQKELVSVGKIGVLVCAAVALVLAISLADELGSIFSYIQEFQGFLSPGALAVFLFGFFVPKCPRFFGWLGIAINVVEYGLIKVCFPEIAFLNRMAICLITIVLIGFVITAINSAMGGKPVVLEDKGIIAMDSSKVAKMAGIAVCIATVALYVLFW